MTFIDDLGLVLNLITLVAVAVFYTAFLVWMSMRSHDVARAQTQLRAGALVLGILGVVLLAFALWGEFTWPLNVTLPDGTNVLAAYNILFFDALTMGGIVLVAFALTVRLRLPTSFAGILGVLVGSALIFYGYRAYNLSLTLDPTEAFALYLAFGGAAILSFPVTLYIDFFVVAPSTPDVAPMSPEIAARYPKVWLGFNAFFLIVLVLAGIAAIIYGFNTIWAHLGAPP